MASDLVMHCLPMSHKKTPALDRIRAGLYGKNQHYVISLENCSNCITHVRNYIMGASPMDYIGANCDHVSPPGYSCATLSNLQ